MTTHTSAPAPKGALLTTGQILSLERRSNMTDDEALRFGRAIESALLSKLRAPVADERVALSQYDYQALFDAIGKAVKVHPNLAIEISVQAFRAALASAPVSGEAQPVGYVEHSREYNFHACPVMTRVIEYPALKNLPNGTKLYAAPQASEAVRDAKDAERWRAFERALHTRIPGPGHGTRIKVVAICPMYGDEKDVSDVRALIDAALSAQPGAQKEQ
ncbi:hypothetical protein [Achromobacter sp. UBA4530]|uniref:hypothetical protein n=1 Tax=Achromobacter sp. UBA4530 TaxID=1945912 RepID=UPI00257A232C|nr:hypothetical protein [Achromobacter sp. UBA4530]